MDYMAAIMWSGETEYDTWRLHTTGVMGIGLLLMEDIVKAWNAFKERFYEWGNQLRRDSAGGRTLWPVLPPLPALPPGQTYSHMSD
jgi:hypothetical protein